MWAKRGIVRSNSGGTGYIGTVHWGRPLLNFGLQYIYLVSSPKQHARNLGCGNLVYIMLYDTKVLGMTHWCVGILFTVWMRMMWESFSEKIWSLHTKIVTNKMCVKCCTCVYLFRSEYGWLEHERSRWISLLIWEVGRLVHDTGTLVPCHNTRGF